MWKFLDNEYKYLAGSLGEVCFASLAWSRLIGGHINLLWDGQEQKESSLHHLLSVFWD